MKYSLVIDKTKDEEVVATVHNRSSLTDSIEELIMEHSGTDRIPAYTEDEWKVLAFIVAGMTAIYQLEQLPLISAILIHGAALYVTYIFIYLINGWLKQQLIPVLVFTAVFVAGYAVIWLIIYFVTKTKTQQINRKLQLNP